jgi:hypothetical protein
MSDRAVDVPIGSIKEYPRHKRLRPHVPLAQLMFSKVSIAETAAFDRYGLGINKALAGIFIGLAFPVVMMM